MIIRDKNQISAMIMSRLQGSPIVLQIAKQKTGGESLPLIAEPPPLVLPRITLHLAGVSVLPSDKSGSSVIKLKSQSP